MGPYDDPRFQLWLRQQQMQGHGMPMPGMQPSMQARPMAGGQGAPQAPVGPLAGGGSPAPTQPVSGGLWERFKGGLDRGVQGFGGLPEQGYSPEERRRAGMAAIGGMGQGFLAAGANRYGPPVNMAEAMAMGMGGANQARQAHRGQLDARDLAMQQAQLRRAQTYKAYQDANQRKPPKTWEVKKRDPKTGEEIIETYQFDPATGETTIVGTGDRFAEKSKFGVEVDPDGRVRVGYGGFGGQDNTKTTNTRLQKTIFDAQDQLGRINRLGEVYDSDFLTYSTQLDQWMQGKKEKFGIELTPEEAQRMDDYGKFRVAAYDNMNRYIKLITGAQMSEREADRIRKAMPDPDRMSATQFKAAMDSVRAELKRVTARAYYAHANGIGTAKSIPLEDINAIYNARGNAIMRQLIDEKYSLEEAEEMAAAQLVKEFGTDLE